MASKGSTFTLTDDQLTNWAESEPVTPSKPSQSNPVGSLTGTMSMFGRPLSLKWEPDLRIYHGIANDRS